MHENNDILKKHLIYRKQQQKQQKLDGNTNTAPINLLFRIAVTLNRHVIIIFEFRQNNAGPYPMKTPDSNDAPIKSMLPWEHPNKGNAEIRMDTNTYLVENMTLITSTDKHINKYHRTDPNTTGVHVRACVQEIIPVLQSPLVF